MNTKVYAVVALVLAVVGSALVLPTQAAPPQPYNLYGLARQSDGSTPIAQGTRITAFIDGVDYSNGTSVYTGTGNYDVDTFGNWVTQIGQDNTPEVKEGGDVGDEIMYVAGDMTGSGQVFTVKKFWTPGDVVLDNLQLAPSNQQPALLKIARIITRPADLLTQYLYICNPTSGVVDMGQYWLQKDVLGSYGGPQHFLSGMINPGSLAYVDLTGALTLVTTGDNIRLTWDNLGGSGFAGSDVIIDRVEFNATAGGTFFWQPGNTVMTDAVAPGLGQEIRRTLACGDTNSNAADFTLNAETGRPGLNTDPTVSLTTPDGGQDWTGGTSHNIVWDMSDAEDASLTYVIGLSLDGGLDGYANLVTGPTSLATGTNRIYSWTVNLVDTVQARIRVCVIDSGGLSACDSSTSNFIIDSTRPVLLTTIPANGAPLIDVNTDVVLTFDEAMSRPETEAAVTFAPPIAGATYSWNPASTVLTVNPNNPLVGSTLYTVTVACTAQDDSDTGNNLAACPRTFTFTTTTGAVAPTVDLTAPDGGQLWSGNTVHAIDWTMTDSDSPGNLNVDLHYSTDGGGSYLNAIATALSLAQGANTYAWTTPCIDSTTVRVRVTASDGALSSQDASAANFAIDCGRPTVTNTVPANGATEVAIATNVVITFSEPMEQVATQGAVTIAPGVSGIVYTWSAGDTVLTVSHNVFTTCTLYTVTVSTAAEDISLPGMTLSPAYSWPFATVCAPAVAVSAPSGGEVWSGGSSQGVQVTITDEDASVNVLVEITTDGGTIWAMADPATLRPTGGLLTITVVLPSVDTTIARFRVTATDSSSLSTAAMSAVFEIDATAPTVSSTVPIQGATGVSLTADFTVTFSEAMDATATAGAISLTPAAGALTFSWNPAVTSVNIGHGSLSRGQAYNLVVSTSATDVSSPGNALSPAFTLSFTATDVSPLTADAGPDQTGKVGDTLTFDGGGSEPASLITGYRWTFLSPTGVSSFANGETTTFVFNQAGTWTVTLNVTDDADNFDTDTATVTITEVQGQDFLSQYWWVILILILAILGAILFLIFGKRRKKEEEEMPEAVPREEVETVPPAAPARAPPARPAAPAPKPAAPRPAVVPPAAPAKGKPTTKECASCGTILDASDTECFMCGSKV